MEAVQREGVVAVIKRGERFLTITRSQTVAAPGKICFPGGGIERGETPEEALIRECSEEIGLSVRPVRFIDVSVTPWNIRLYWYAAEIEPDAVPQPNPAEVAAVQWLTIPEMLAHPAVLESNVPMLNALCSSCSNENVWL